MPDPGGWADDFLLDAAKSGTWQVLSFLLILSQLCLTWAWRDERWEMWKQLCLLLSRAQRSRCLGWLRSTFSKRRWTAEGSSSLNKISNVRIVRCITSYSQAPDIIWDLVCPHMYTRQHHRASSVKKSIQTTFYELFRKCSLINKERCQTRGGVRGCCNF